MPLRFYRKSELQHTSRHVRNDAYETFRLLLASDGLGVTITDIVLKPSIEATYGHERHVEMAYCIEGRAHIVDHATGRRTQVTPGTLWVAEKGDSFLFGADEPTRLICVFSPPFDGHETGFAGDQ
jgi:L-ectoine synthase